MNIMNKTPLSLVFALCVALPTFGDESNSALPIVRASLVPPAALDEQIETPSGRYQGLKPLGEISLDSSPPEGPLPEDRSDEFFPEGSTQLDDSRELRGWTLTEFHWQAPDICHPPLYFEHVSLEVHGQSVNRHLQPLLSGARFFATIPLLPIKMARAHPHVHISTLGQFRPGSPAGCLSQECTR
jgi:hypothetical protein